LYKVGKAIRGGVPVCFPWFGAKADDPKAPSHGFVRNREWQLESIAGDGGNVIVTLLTRSDDSTKPFWPTDFELRLRASFGQQLRLQLQCSNTGSQPARFPARFEEALHAYFTVGDALQAGVNGLDGTDYLDKTDGNQRKSQSGAVKISAETDRVYLDTAAPLEIHDPVMKRRIRIEKENSRNSVVWNPWSEKARALADFGDDEWTGMMCVEPSNVAANSVEMAPGQQHTMGVTISVSGL
jgi:glucose-6-phosphate 1-epimerase